MTRVYGWRALRLIASRVGPCHDRREMLECIERAAQDYLTALDSPSAAPMVVRDQLRVLAKAAGEAHRAFDGLDLGSDLHLAYMAGDRGFKLPTPDDLAGLAAAAIAAADMPVVKRGGQPAALDGFLGDISRIVEDFAGWRAVYTVSRVYRDAEDDIVDEALYSGRFFNVVKACSEPLGIKKSDSAFAKAISRALSKDKLPA